MSMATNNSTWQTSIFVNNSSEFHNLPVYLITISCSTNLVLGLPAHCYILWLSMKEMIRGQSFEVFVFNTSLIEVIFNFCYAFVIKQYFFNCSYCMYVTIILALVLLVGRPLFQTFTCVERYVGVLHPVTFLKLKPMKYRIIISVIGWILIFFSCLLTGMGVIDICSLLLSEYLIFLITKVFTCLTVLKALKRPGPGEDVKKKDGVNRDKVKAFQIIQIVLVCSVVTYAPMVISLVLYYICDNYTFVISWSFCSCSAVMLGFLQPLLYFKRIRKVGLGFRLCS